MKSIFRKELKELKSYIPGKPIEDVMREYGLTEVVKLASNENPLGPSHLAVDAIRYEAENIHIYPDPSVKILKEKIAKKHGVKETEILLGNGGEELLKLIAQSIIEEGDEAIMAEPSFSLYEISVNHMGGKSIKIQLTNDYKHDFEAFVNHITDRTKIIYVCNPNNPTGNIMTKDELDYLVDTIPEDVVLLLDEAYYEFAAVNEDYPDGLDILRKRPNTIVLRTFAKVSGLAGLRVGYIFSSEEIIREISKSKGVFNVNRLAQIAASAAMDDTDHIERTVALNTASLNMMIDYFEHKSLEYIPSGANFIFVNCHRDSREIFVELQKRGVIIRPGFLWNFDNWLRISSGTIESTEILIKALDEIL